MAIAETSEKYRAISAAEFFYKYKEIAGFANPARALYQTIRELVENALDATDAHGILPNIKIVIEKADQVHEYYKITVEDNGIGLPPHIVPEAFGRVLFSSKYVLRQTRGMFGLGVKVAVLYG
ncbi:MAG: ATP-binding protein, partial [Staphylothermus sp.]|nr:ATP-binding protein [Staphylothermus sp.]